MEAQDFFIVLLEELVYDEKKQLLTRERHYIESTDCVNHNVPTRTFKEWYKEQWVECECGLSLYKYSMKAHITSKKHKAAVSLQNELST
eukprot:45376-Eustigmatos_ZCMA.PRE.1